MSQGTYDFALTIRNEETVYYAYYNGSTGRKRLIRSIVGGSYLLSAYPEGSSFYSVYSEANKFVKEEFSSSFTKNISRNEIDLTGV